MIGDDKYSVDFSAKHLIIITPLSQGLCITGVLCDLPAHIPDSRAFHRYQYITGIVIFNRS